MKTKNIRQANYLTVFFPKRRRGGKFEDPEYCNPCLWKFGLPQDYIFVSDCNSSLFPSKAEYRVKIKFDIRFNLKFIIKL